MTDGRPSYLKRNEPPRPGGRVCVEASCGRRHYARGWCTMHYLRWLQHGDPRHSARRRGGSLRDRLLSFVDFEDTDSCIEWRGAVDLDGYGWFSYANKRRRAHRVSYELAHGPVPPGAVVRHSCDNRPCINPRHLEVGTTQDNTRDRDERGRAARGERAKRSHLREADVLAIRAKRGERTLRSLADEYRVSVSTIHHIVTRKTWRHI